MKNLLKEFLLIMVFTAIAVILPLIWIDEGYLFISEEDHFANYQKVIIKNSSSWDYSINMGGPTHPSLYTVRFPNGVLYNLLSNANLSNDKIQKIFLGLSIFVTLMAVSYMIRLFTQNKLIIANGALFYYLNFYTRATIFYSAKTYQLILMPLFFTYTYLFLKTNKFKYVVYNFLCLFFLQGIFTNLATFASTSLMYPLAIFYYLISEKRSFFQILRSKLLPIIIFFFFLLPLFFNSGLSYYLYIINSSLNTLKNINSFTAMSSPINLILQFRGSWWEFLSSADGVSYNYWGWFYNSFFIILISFLLLALGLYPLFTKKFNKSYLFFIISLIIGVFFASGSSFFPEFYSLFYKHVPFFYIFREPWAKFTPLLILSLTILISITLENISSTHKKKVIIICLILILIRGLPFFSYYFLDKQVKRWSIPFIKLPDYWKEWQKWSIANSDKTVILKPINYFKRNWYKEDYGNANHPIASIFGYTNTIFELKINTFGEIIDYFINKNNNNFIKILPLDYLLDQKDIETNPKYFSNQNKTYNQNFMQFFQDTPAISFGSKLFLYPIKNEFKLPLIYQPRKIFLTNDVKGLTKIISEKEYPLNSAIYYYGHILNEIKLIENFQDNLNNSIDLSDIKYIKVNDEKYKVSLSHVVRPTIIVFNTSFNKFWQLVAKNDQNLNDVPHFLVNGYANSWFIDPQKLCNIKICQKNVDGSYNLDLIIKYAPQEYFDALFSIILIVLAGGVFYLTGYFIIKALKHE